MTAKSKSLRIACRNPSVMDELASLQKPPADTVDVVLKWGFRRVPLSRGRHHGGYVSAFLGQPVVRVESVLERRVVKTLAAEPMCVAIATQPVTMQWVWNGMNRRYTPDVLVIFKHLPSAWQHLGMERISLVEVKPTRFSIDDDLWTERVRIVKQSMGIPLVRLPAQMEVLV